MNSALVVSRGRPAEERTAVQSSSTSSSVVAHYGVEEIRSVSAEEQSQYWGEGGEVSSNGGEGQPLQPPCPSLSFICNNVHTPGAQRVPRIRDSRSSVWGC